MRTQLHPQVKASPLLPSVRDDSATTLVTRTTVPARQIDKKLVGWVHDLKENTEEINVVCSSKLQMVFAFPLRKLE